MCELRCKLEGQHSVVLHACTRAHSLEAPSAPLLTLRRVSADMNEYICGIALLPRLHALGLLAPRTLTDAPLLLPPASTVGMVHRIHGNSTRLHSAQTVLDSAQHSSISLYA